MKSKKSTLKRTLILLVLLVLVVSAFFFLNKNKGQNYQEAQTTLGAITTYYNFTGALNPKRIQHATALENGKIDIIYVKSGDLVEKNDRLFRLSSGTIVKSDIKGEVTNVLLYEDDTVQAGQEVLTVADLDTLKIDIKVDEYDVKAVHVGQDVLIKIPAINYQTSAQILTLDKIATQTPTATYYNASLDIQAENNMLPGMEVGVEVLKDSVQDAVLLKTEAIKFSDNNTPYVVLKDKNGKYVTQEITVGISNGMMTEIKFGVNQNTNVYYSQNHFQSMQDFMMARSGFHD